MIPETWALALLDELMELAGEDRARLLRTLPARALRAIAEAWFWQAHGGQREPEGDWLTWLLMASRSFGKTRAGAEWVWARVREARTGAGNGPLQIALVGANFDEVRKVMVKGPTGLIATAGTGESATWCAEERVLRFGCGAQAFAYSAEAPEGLRGPQHHFAWCDELAKWRHADETWDNLMLGLRLGTRPRTLVTTTPRAVPLLRRIRALDRLAETNGRMVDNLHLPEAAVCAARRAYGGTRFGRQELDGELIEDVEGSLWPRQLIEDCRVEPIEDGATLSRIVVGVDPPASAEGVCGISVCGLDEEGMHYVLADASVAGASPERWARAVARTAEAWRADRVIAEANQGGDMVESVLRNVAPGLPVRTVHASRGKIVRAEPVAALFEKGEARFAGRFPALEDELAGMTNAGGYEGPGRSPDRADAMVWAMTELMPASRRGEPRIRML